MSNADSDIPMQRMLITIEYDGTGLVGWQRQNNGPSVQAYLEAAAEKLTNRETHIQGSGRTDAGVHATAQAAHLDVPASLNNFAVVNGLNAWLENDQISVLSASPVGTDFNARFDAIDRGYLIVFWTGAPLHRCGVISYGIIAPRWMYRLCTRRHNSWSATMILPAFGQLVVRQTHRCAP